MHSVPGCFYENNFYLNWSNSSILNILKSEKGAGLPLFLKMIFFS